ncbi:acyl-coenzyme A synthetase/AMP-(fatty) acid ligase [Afipia massiliensis]|uniref:Acyl-coenzyme A synthetase/AMP-(Fatty) acid ligase n=1 Tax=Afipia massiliensis TaxID=211460 RepID=A0A840N4R1_9BRAD|nr:AMP-binding protein [Afipia massiliensis]MBB5053892.1 acyl-coenzyme A synthetase/AMP-(fatty) acid ligase [Afipia massiliensis]
MRDVWAPERHSEQSYDAMCAAFRWDIPETFNFGADVIDRWARERNGPALIWENEAGEERTYSYSDLSLLSNRLANVLRSRGVTKGDRVIVMLPRLPEWFISMIAVMKIGAVPIPSIEMLTARDVEYRVKNAEVKAAICRPEHAGKFDGVETSIPVRLATGRAQGWLNWHEECACAPETIDAPIVNAEDPAIMYYTSGSTGHPKAVVHASRAIYAWRVSAVYWLDLRPQEIIWCTADTGWAKAGTSILFGPLSCGACSFFYDGPFVPKERLRLLRKHNITVYCAPGTELSRVVDEVGGRDIGSLRRVVTAGEAMNPVIASRWEDATGIRIDEAYGQTEALMVALNYTTEPVRYGSMGRPSPGSDLDVIDAQGQRLPPGSEGDLALLLPNPQLMLEYWKDPEKTEACILNGSDGHRWYLTGDRAERDAEGYFWYRGRSDDMINSAGYRIGPLEVENALFEHQAVRVCAVVGSPDVERGEIVKAFVVLRDGVVPSPELTRELQDHVKSVTAPYKYPRAIEYLSELPVTITGKIRRRDLRDRELARAQDSAGT